MPGTFSGKTHHVIAWRNQFVIVGKFGGGRYIWRYSYKDVKMANGVAAKQDHRWSREYDEQRTLQDIAGNYWSEMSTVGFAARKNDEQVMHVVRSNRSDVANEYFEWAEEIGQQEYV